MKSGAFVDVMATDVTFIAGVTAVAEETTDAVDTFASDAGVRRALVLNFVSDDLTARASVWRSTAVACVQIRQLNALAVYARVCRTQARVLAVHAVKFSFIAIANVRVADDVIGAQTTSFARNGLARRGWRHGCYDVLAIVSFISLLTGALVTPVEGWPTVTVVFAWCGVTNAYKFTNKRKLLIALIRAPPAVQFSVNRSVRVVRVQFATPRKVCSRTAINPRFVVVSA